MILNFKTIIHEYTQIAQIFVFIYLTVIFNCAICGHKHLC